MARLGLIPAAGFSQRFDGCIKELLPINDNERVIDNTFKVLKSMDMILLVTNLHKAHEHIRHIHKRKNLQQVYIAVQKGEQDIWSAIKESFALAQDFNYFVMPDTIIPENALDIVSDKHLIFWCFETTMPERFGVFVDGKIINKQPLEGTYQAWGSIMWSKEVVKLWQRMNIETYTEAFNEAIKYFDYDVFPLRYYYDMASWQDYREYICSHTQ